MAGADAVEDAYVSIILIEAVRRAEACEECEKMATRVAAGPKATGRETTSRTSLTDSDALSYRWVVLASACMMMLASAGVSQAFSLFVKPMAMDFGGARGNVSIAYAIYMVCFGAGSFITAWLADRVHMRLLLLIAAASYSLGAILSGLANSLWTLNLAFGVLNGGAVGSLVGCLTYAVAQWFSLKKGLALGILLAGMGMGVFISSMTAGMVMDLYGWRGAFVLLGVWATLVNIPAALLIQPRVAVGAAKEHAHQPSALQHQPAPAIPGTRWSTASAVKTWSFWSLNTTFVCCCLSHSILLLHYIPYASDLGLTAQRSAWLVTIGGLSNVVGRISMGALSDWIGGKPALSICLVMQTLMVVWAMTYTSWPAWVVFAILFGIGSGGVFPLYPAITRSYFGAEGTGGIFGLQLLLSTVFGMALGPLLGGYSYDVFKTYHGAFLVSIVVGVLSVLLLFTVRPPRLRTGR
jgi:MFS family permease